MDKLAILEIVLFDEPSNKWRATRGVADVFRKFNAALSLCRVLGVVFYFSKSFSETAARVSAVAKAPRPLGETVVCFLGQESSLWFPVLQ